jgi:hypothetical protein
MLTESLAMEHYRLHVIERWPEGDQKDAALGGVQSALDGLLRAETHDAPEWRCIVCGDGLRAGLRN